MHLRGMKDQSKQQTKDLKFGDSIEEFRRGRETNLQEGALGMDKKTQRCLLVIFEYQQDDPLCTASLAVLLLLD